MLPRHPAEDGAGLARPVGGSPGRPGAL